MHAQDRAGRPRQIKTVGQGRPRQVRAEQDRVDTGRAGREGQNMTVPTQDRAGRHTQIRTAGQGMPR